ncbi:RICIN domain-containing protein [Saccharothrix sp. BKS2]|uniref:RICIN domain-containing protein n=1 Tax=Saccharothrix sp. BKS2 TaxID=3064400 RepID=UPI0039E84AB4
MAGRPAAAGGNPVTNAPVANGVLPSATRPTATGSSPQDSLPGRHPGPGPGGLLTRGLLTSWRHTRWSGRLHLTAQHSGKAAEVDEASTADGSRIAQRTCNGNPDQRFTRRRVGPETRRGSGPRSADRR